MKKSGDDIIYIRAKYGVINKLFNVKRKVIVLSGYIKELIESDDLICINIDPGIFNSIIKYCTHHWNDKKIDDDINMLKVDKFDDAASRWDKIFFEKDILGSCGNRTDILIKYAKIVKPLKIKKLYDLLCLKLADEFRHTENFNTSLNNSNINHPNMLQKEHPNNNILHKLK